MENIQLKKLEEIFKELSIYEKRGLDTSSLKIFIKDFKEFLKSNYSNNNTSADELPLDNKLKIIRLFLEDKKVFPTINDIIVFANDNLGIEFRDQKEKREVTINRIIKRIVDSPELKEALKKAVLAKRNEKLHKARTTNIKKEIISAETFGKWAEIIKNI